jgi:hypothetical protein
MSIIHLTSGATDPLASSGTQVKAVTPTPCRPSIDKNECSRHQMRIEHNRMQNWSTESAPKRATIRDANTPLLECTSGA